MDRTAHDDGAFHPKRPPARWWPAAAILAASGAAAVWIRFFLEVQFQQKNIYTAAAALSALALLLAWALLFSRLPGRIRLAILILSFGTVAAAVSIVRIRGVTGDLVPILEWRWEKRSPLPEEEPPADGSPSPDGPDPSVAGLRDYPGFLGPLRNGSVDGPDLARDWSADPPVLLWRRPVRPAWSGFAVSGRIAVTQEQRGEEEAVTACDALSGRPLWVHSDRARFSTTIAGEGPRATPAIAGGRVYAMGATGILNCLELATGRALWTKDLLRENGGQEPEWGMASSPLVAGDLLVTSPCGGKGRGLAAYRLETGEFVWGAGDERAPYSSPSLAVLAGARQVLIFHSGGIASHDPASGRILWGYPWPRGHPHITAPLVLPGDRVLVSSGYGTGSELLEVQSDAAGKLSASRLWKSTRLKAKFANVVALEGFIYGLDDGILACLDAASGDLKWKGSRYGHGQMVLVRRLLLVTAEDGSVVLIEPAPEEERVLGTFQALEGKTWNPPALAGQFLLLRNDREAACYRLPVSGGR